MLFRLNLAIGCCESVQVLHQQNPIVVHGDIKGQNFLLNDDHMVKIADLELASRCYSMDSSSDDFTKLAAAANNGNIYTSTDLGATWVSRASTQYWWGITSSADGTKLAAVTSIKHIWVIGY